MAGKIQNEDIKSAAELVSAGATAASLPNDTKVYVTANSINKTLNQAITDGDIGSSGLNYIGMPASTGASITGWATYADAAGTAPVDGTGGSPASTFTTSTDSSIVGATNFIWTKSAANRQGEGFSYDFTIDQGYQSKPFTISFLYKIASGTFADNDMSVWIYDVTNAVLIQPSAYQIKNSTGVERIKCEFQASSNSTSYRLIIHTASTSASAYTLRFDSFSVSPNTYNAGAVVTDWVAYTPTITGFGTPTAVNGFYRRVGDSIEVTGSYTAGTPTAVAAQISLPTGLAINTAKLSSTANAGYLGVGHRNNNEMWSVFSDGSTTGSVFLNRDAATGAVGFFAKTLANVSNASDDWMFNFMVPILGWGTTQVLSSDTDTRVVDMEAVKSAGSTSSGGATPTASWTLINKDSHGAFNATTGVYTVPVPGDYLVTHQIFTTTGAPQPSIIKNGSINYYGWASGVSAGFVSRLLTDLKAGDTISVGTGAAFTVLTATSPYQTSLSIQRLSGPAQIAASEKIYLQYTGNAGTALTANVTNIDFTNKVSDSHGAWNGTTFTAPRPGWYEVKGAVSFTASASQGVNIYVNGTKGVLAAYTPSTDINIISGSTYLKAGDQLSLRVDSTKTLSNSATSHWISITSQG